MEIKKEKVIKDNLNFLTVAEYREQYGNGITAQAVYYAMQQGLIDYMAPAREKFVVMTDRTKQYVPNANVNRAIITT